jgi:multidrug efflux pump subunit AcrA (membrane-fusion protein)
VVAGELLLRLDSSVQQAQHDLAREDVRAAEARVDEACLVQTSRQSCDACSSSRQRH